MIINFALMTSARLTWRPLKSTSCQRLWWLVNITSHGYAETWQCFWGEILTDKTDKNLIASMFLGSTLWVIKWFRCFLIIFENAKKLPSKHAIILGDSVRQHPVSTQSWWIYVFASQSTLVCPRVGVHRIYMGTAISFQTFFVQAFKIVVDSWKFSMLLLYIFYDFSFKSTATAAIGIHPTKAWLSQRLNFKNAIWHFRRTICNKILF